MSRQTSTLLRNEQIAALLAQGGPYTPEQLEQMQQYSGSGGLWRADVRPGAAELYEYYTPDEVVARMWALAYKYGFTVGRVLEPSAGVGRFIRYADPTNCTVRAFEINETSGGILKACYPWADVTIGPFETIFYPDGPKGKRAIPPADFDLVIGNPPYGDRDGRMQGPLLEGRHTQALTLDQYFIEKGVDLLKSGGLLVFIIPSGFLDNGNKYNRLKERLADKCTLVDAYRMPMSLFEFTGIATDIIVLQRK